MERIAEGEAKGNKPPPIVHETMKEVAREHGPRVAVSIALGMLTGPLGLAAGGGGLATLGSSVYASTGKVRDAIQQQRAADQAHAAQERERALTAVVPDADRPVEAQALLAIADAAPAERNWRNPETGAAGRVAVAPMDEAAAGIECLRVDREYRRDGTERRGMGLICEQDGVWYDLL